MHNSTANNKRIAKNTLLLYFRMLFMMAISLYTSRIVLSTLGFSDYGIYNVVGGFVALFTMVSGTMATATQRFISFEIGKGTQENITRLFSTSMIIHLLLCCVILILAETIGLWFVNNKIVFPPERLTAVNWVYQFSVFTLIINVLSVPYNASIIAYEKMATFAYIGILEAALKLLVVYLIIITTIDKLISYAFLLMIISVGIRIIYNVYVNAHFRYCRCNWRLDKVYCKKLLSFIGFNFIGSIAAIAKTQGLNVLLNLFFGTIVNAARGISVQVLNAISGFVVNFQTALNPQIVKLYAAGEKQEMFKLIFRGCKYSYLLLLLISMPILLETPYILNLWLVDVPEYTVVFVRLIIAITLVDSQSHTLIIGIHASGNVKKYQLINGTVLLLTLPLAYVFFVIGNPPYVAFVVSLVISIVCHFIRLLLLKSIIGFPFVDFVKNVTGRVIVVTFLSSIAPMAFLYVTEDGFLRFATSCVISFVSVSFCVFYLGLTSIERSTLKKEYVDKIKHFKW